MVSAAAVYWPGLSGGFLFDDFVNLPALGRYGGVHDWKSLTWYATSGIADPTGRPVSMLSFLIDARDWPAEPWSFKRTNLVLHLANGALLYSLLVALGRRVVSDPAMARHAALLGTALWLLHPLWASTVLYVVQRHAMLAAGFVLCGLRAWVASRDAFDAGRVRKGWLLAICAVPVFGLLAGLSKANGFLLPLLIVTLQATVLLPSAHRSGASRLRRHEQQSAFALAWLPALLVLCGLALQGARAWTETPALRGWSIGDRLLTQPRALLDYLHALFVPGIEARGVFADDYAVSTNLAAPWTTLPALLTVIALLLLAARLRRTAPAFAAAALFYLAGHAMESSIIPLELYFEHRNYLPSILLAWPIALWACSRRSHGRLITAGLVLLVALLAILTTTQARLWGDPDALALHWAETYPDSLRAQAYAAGMDVRAGRTRAAVDRLQPLARLQPAEPQIVLPLLDAKCAAGTATPADAAAAAVALRESGVTLDLTYHWMSRQLGGNGPTCSAIRDGLQTALLPAALTIPPHTPEEQARTAYLRALGALQRGDCIAAREAFDARTLVQRRPEFVQTQTGLLGTHCGAAIALGHLETFLRDGNSYMSPPNAALKARDWLMERDGYWNAEWKRLRQVLKEDARTAYPQ